MTRAILELLALCILAGTCPLWLGWLFGKTL